MKRVDIIYFDAGSGHRSAAKGLERALASARPGWRVSMVNLLDVLARNRQFHRIVRAGIGYFNWQLKREQVFDLKGLINLSLKFHDCLSPRGIRQIGDFWADDPPDAVVSVTPMYNPALYRGVRLINPRALCLTIPVDFEEVRPRYWFTPRVEQHYLVATGRLAEQAKAAGIPGSHITRIPGMIIDPAFYEAPPRNLARERERLGLDPALPTGLVSFGGQGSVLIDEIAARLAGSGLALNLIFLCGRHAAVYERLSRQQTPYRKLVLGYSRETPIYYHHLADFIIGKPGSMTITEALIDRKPLIAIQSRGLRPVQRGNEEWLRQHGVGLIVERMEQLAAAVREVNATSSYRWNAGREFHCGVFNAAATICSLLEKPKNFRPGEGIVPGIPLEHIAAETLRG